MRTLPALASTNFVVGAIRWDAWAGNSSTNAKAQQDLFPPQFQSRAPACAVATSGLGLSFAGCNTQAAMDAEITAANGAGLNYWAYCWYGTPLAAGNPFQNAWALHQSSSIKNQVKWCIIFQLSDMGGASAFAAAFSTLTGYLAQSNYQTVLSGRPLVYILIDQNTPLSWGGSFSSFQTSLNSFRSACTSAGLLNPYIVTMGSAGTGTAAGAYAVSQQCAADAFGGYTSPTVPAVGGAAYASQIASDAANWAACAATGGSYVPTVQTGWDTRPRSQNCSSLACSAGQKSWIGSNYYVAPGTPSQIASDFTAALAFITANASACPSKAVLAYSWNEDDEGGSGLNPTWSASGPVHAELDAVGAILNAN